MLRVDLLHNSNDFESNDLQQLRSRMLSVFKEAELPPHWHEWSVDDKSLPYYLRGFGPFSIFINGKRVKADIDEMPSDTKPFCAVHHCLPSESLLLTMLQSRQGWTKLKMHLAPKLISFVFVVPFLMLVIFPVSMCSGCWPGYMNASLDELTQLNYGKLNTFVYPSLLLTGNLAIAVLFLRSFFTKQLQLFLLVLVSIVAILSSKLIQTNLLLEYGGLLLFVAVSVWLCFANKQPEACPRCSALRMDKIP